MTYYSKFQEDVVSSATPPANPVADQLWWKLPEQTLYIWDDVLKLWVLNRAIAANDPSKAPLDSPVFTGNPRAPTPPQGDADSSIATTAFVKVALDADTADWTQVLNKPATYPPTLPITQADVTDLVTDLGFLAPKDNPVFTGNPKAPTPLPGDNDTSIATTAFVISASGGLFPNGTVNQYLRGDKSWQTLNKAAVGLGNVDNTADTDKPVSTQQANADALRVLKAGDTMSGSLTISPVGAPANLGLLALGTNNAGIILSTDPSSSSMYLESRTGISTRWQMFIGDNVAESGISSESGGTNFSLRRFRNDGVFLGEVITILRSDGVVNFTVGATSPTPNFGDNSTKVATTAFVVGSIGAKEPTISTGTISQYWRGDKSWQTLDKTAVGLGNVDNTSDIGKPISTATQIVLDLKASINNPVFTGKVTVAASGSSLAGLRLPHGVNPTTPVNGDLWSTSTGFYGMVNGVVVGPMGPGVQGIQGIQGPKGDKGDPGPQGAQVMYIGDGPPAVPLVGQTWWESDTGNSFIYYDDGSGAPQWVPQNVGSLPTSGGSGGIPEAPLDGQQYARQSAAWSVVTGGGGGSGVTDGDKGDIVVSASGLTWMFDSTVVTTVAKTLLDDTTTVAMLSTLGAAPTVHTHTTAQVTGLDTALAGKEPSLPAGGTASNFLRGDKAWAVPSITDGDKGDIVVSASGATWMLDSTVVTAVAKTLLDDTSTGAMLTTLGAAPTVHTHAYSSLTSIPLTFAPSPHNHPTNEITGLDAALNSKEPLLPAGGTTLTYLRGDKTWAEVDTGGLSFSYEYTFDTSTTEPVSSANVKFNNISATATTKIWVHDLSAIGKDNSNIFTLFTAGDRLYFQDKDDATKWQSFNLTGPIADKGTYTEFPVVFRNGGLPLPAQRIVFIVEGGTSSGVGEAPVDGQQYARQSASWQVVTSSGGGGDGGIPEAPSDGKLYARKNSSWDDLTNDFAAKADHTDAVFHSDLRITNGNLIIDYPGYPGVGNILFGEDWQAYIYCESGMNSMGMLGYPVKLQGPVSVDTGTDGNPTEESHLTTKYYVDNAIDAKVTGGKITIATTAPSSPATGDVWIDIS